MFGCPGLPRMRALFPKQRGLHSWEAHLTGKGCHPRSACSRPGSPSSKSFPNARLESPTVKAGHVGSFKWESAFQEQLDLPGTDL